MAIIEREPLELEAGEVEEHAERPLGVFTPTPGQHRVA